MLKIDYLLARGFNLDAIKSLNRWQVKCFLGDYSWAVLSYDNFYRKSGCCFNVNLQWCGRHDGLAVSTMNFGKRDLGLSP